MATVTIVRENGQRDQVEFTSNATLEREDGETFQPSVVQRMEYDAEGEDSSITTNCGETEQRQEGAKPPDIVMEGIVGESELPQLKGLRSEYITLVSPTHSGEIYVRRVTIEQTADVVDITLNGGETEKAFGYQLQLRQPE